MGSAADIVFPPSCVSCGRVLAADAYFCPECEVDVERLPDERCPRCAEPGELAAGRACSRCEVRPPPFERTFAPFTHGGAVARAIHQYKYEDHPELARPLGQLLAIEARAFLAQLPANCGVAAIPLHRSRLASRRYDQAELLAGEVARHSKRARLDALERTKSTERQVGLSEAARDANLSGAFKARGGLEGLEVILVDDVFTTGATARAAAFALRGAGVTRVFIITLARAFTV